jgi:hypothetical protein
MEIHVAAAACAAEVEGRRGGFGGGSASARRKRRLINAPVRFVLHRRTRTDWRIRATLIGTPPELTRSSQRCGPNISISTKRDRGKVVFSGVAAA